MQVRRIVVEGGRGERERERERERDSMMLGHINLDPYEDQFEKSAEKRKEAVAKNEFHRLRNVKTAQKAGKIKGMVVHKLIL